MKTFKRICKEDKEIKLNSGEKFQFKKGKEYITSKTNPTPAVGKGKLVVFDLHWMIIDEDLFEEEATIYTQ